MKLRVFVTPSSPPYWDDGAIFIAAVDEHEAAKIARREQHLYDYEIPQISEITGASAEGEPRILQEAKIMGW